MNSTIYIPPRFKHMIHLHVVKNLLATSIVGVPLLLGIHGSSGDGKTYQCEHTLKEIGMKVFLISGGELESPDAGTPAELIRKTYLDAGKYQQKKENLGAVVLMNDIDAGLGNWGELTQYTVNRQQVIAELMHLADYPTSVQNPRTRENENTLRIPIIVTGNDFTKLYAPLIRTGRMKGFAWQPTVDEKVGIVSGLFPELRPEQHTELVQTFPAQPIAFFASLRSSLADAKLS